MATLMRVVDRVVVLDHGEKIAEGRPAGGGRGPAASSRRTSARSRRAWQLERCSSCAASPRATAPSPRSGTSAYASSAGEAVAVVGPNGAGKTTLLRVISGLIAAARRPLVFEGAELAGRPAHEIVAHGIAHVPEGRRLFPALTVADNLKMGAYPARGAARATARASSASTRSSRSSRSAAPSARAACRAASSRCWRVGRALMSRPKLILLDEPSMGLAPVMVLRLFDLIRRVREEGYTILVVEQNVRQVLKIVDRAYLLEVGRIKMEGRAAELVRGGLRAQGVRRPVIEPDLPPRGGDQRHPARRHPRAAGARAEPDLRRHRHRLDRLRRPRHAVHVRRVLLVRSTAGRLGWRGLASSARRAARRRACTCSIITPILAARRSTSSSPPAGSCSSSSPSPPSSGPPTTGACGCRLPTFEIAGIFLPFTRLIPFGMSILAMVALYLFLTRTFMGTAIRAVARTARPWRSWAPTPSGSTS